MNFDATCPARRTLIMLNTVAELDKCQQSREEKVASRPHWPPYGLVGNISKSWPLCAGLPHMIDVQVQGWRQTILSQIQDGMQLQAGIIWQV